MKASRVGGVAALESSLGPEGGLHIAAGDEQVTMDMKR
jgi:hypothetical protein